MKLRDFMVRDALVPQLKSRSRDETIRELVEALSAAGRIMPAHVEDIISKLVERESQGSTGIGKGIAVPHIKHTSISEIVGTIGINGEGIDFNSLDKAPVYSVLLLLSPPNNPDQHLEAMENLFSHLQRDRFRKFLRQASTREALVDLIMEADDQSEEGTG